MRLQYITRTGLPSKAAQSVQIASMCQAFYGLLREDFKLVSTINEANEDLVKEYAWDKVRLSYKSRLLRNCAFVCKVIPKLVADRPTHVFTRDIAVALISQKIGLETTYEIHKEPLTNIARILMHHLSRKRNFRIVSISGALQDYCIHKHRSLNKNISVHHDGVFLDAYDELRSVPKEELRRQLNLPVDVKILMHTGSLYEGRGAEFFEVVLRAFPQCLFVHVGGREEDIKKWSAYYESFPNVSILPHQSRSQLTTYQMSADLLFLPMTRDNPIWWCTSPMKLFEYMATGIPVLASNIGSVGEVINERNAIIFDPERPESIVEGVRFFIAYPEQANQRARYALEDVRNKYTWEQRALTICQFMGLL